MSLVRSLGNNYKFILVAIDTTPKGSRKKEQMKYL